MKRYIILTSLTIIELLTVSCSVKRQADEDCNCNRTTVIVAAHSGATKVADLSMIEDSQVNDLQVFCFRPDGTVDSYGYVEEGDQLELECTIGERRFVAVANGPSIAAATSPDDALKIASQAALTDNYLDSFVMAGELTKTISPDDAVLIPVRRQLAQLAIKKISVAWKEEALKTADFKITDIFILNASGEVKEGAVTTWYNAHEFKGEQNKWLHGGLDLTMADGDVYETEHRFFTCPNPTDVDTFGEEWSPRHTRLVVQALLNGKVCYYPMTFGVIESNKTYIITGLTITVPGIDSPDGKIEKGNLDCTVEVIDWETGEVIEEIL